MTQVDDLSRSLVAFEQSSTMAIVVEMSQLSWLVAGVVPGLDRGPLKKVGQYHCLSQLAVDHGPRWW